MHTMRNTSRGFTLIELLVVISIIGMLSSIILVSLNGARQKGTLGSALHFADNNYHKLGANTLFSANFNEGLGSVASKDQTGNFSPSPAVVHVANTPFGDSGYSLDDSSAGSSGTVISYSSGSGSSITVPDTSGITLSLWYNASTPSGNLLNVCFNNSNCAQFGRLLFAGGGIIRCNFGLLITYTPTTDANWHNITCAYSSSTGGEILYYDGKQVNAGTYTSPYAPSTLDGMVCIGGFISAGVCSASNFVGLLDNVQIFSGSLTASAVGKLYAEGIKMRTLASAR